MVDCPEVPSNRLEKRRIDDRFRLGGEIKVFPEDFVVEEVWEDRVYTVDFSLLNRVVDGPSSFRDTKDYLHFTLVKRDWTTVKALQYMAKRLHVSLKRFNFSGMKDKRALTAQRVSAWRVEARDLRRLRLKDVRVKDLGYSDERLTLGDASGNRFTITIRNIPHGKAEIHRILDEFGSVAREGKIPNFFGPQRLGGGNVAIGKAIVDGDLKLATEILLQKVQPYLEKGSVEDLPDVFWIEKRVLQHLKNHSNDYAGALRKIPKKIRRIFTHSVQSQAFNEALQEAVLKGDVPEVLEVEGFHVGRMPELSTHSIQRRGYLDVRGFSILRVEDGVARIRFTLGSGEYATTFLSYLGVG